MVDSVSVRFKNARVEKNPLNIRIQWNVGTACVSDCGLKTLACRGLRVGPSKPRVIQRVVYTVLLSCVQAIDAPPLENNNLRSPLVGVAYGGWSPL